MFASHSFFFLLLSQRLLPFIQGEEGEAFGEENLSSSWYTALQEKLACRAVVLPCPGGDTGSHLLRVQRILEKETAFYGGSKAVLSGLVAAAW